MNTTPHATWWNTPSAPAAVEVLPGRPSTAERIAARRERLAGITSEVVEATRREILAQDGYFDPELERLILSGLSAEQAVEVLCGAPISLFAEDLRGRCVPGALDLTGEPVPDFDSGVYDDGSLAITMAAAGGHGFGEVFIDGTTDPELAAA